MENTRRIIPPMYSNNYSTPNVPTSQPSYRTDYTPYTPPVTPILQATNTRSCASCNKAMPGYYNPNVNMNPTGNRPLSYCENNCPIYLPMFPMNGYDNSKECDDDAAYMKSMYPKTCKVIQNYIDSECDKLEYEGSCMFDEYPDKCHLGAIVMKIYEQVRQTINITLEVDSLDDSSTTKVTDEELREVENENKKDVNASSLEAQQFFNSFGPSHRRNDWLSNLIEIMLFNEIFNRRRRHRRRRRWF